MNKFIVLILIFILLVTAPSVMAQDETVTGPIYIVQPDDNLWDIAVRFGVAFDNLININHITEPDVLNAGDQLVIPGLEGIEGVLTTETVTFGETIHSLSFRYGITPKMLEKLNHITNPIELYSGSSLVIPQKEENSPFNKRVLLAQGQTLLELSILNDTNPWEFTSVNNLPGPWGAIPGHVLFISGDSSDGPGAFPSQFTSIGLSPTFPLQGKTASLVIDATGIQSISGIWMDHELHFFNEIDNKTIALQGVHAMAPPGLYPLTIQVVLDDSTQLNFMQSVLIVEGGYVFDPVLYVDPTTIDPTVTKPEDAQWTALSSPASTKKYWDNIFSIPVDQVFADCIPSKFGNRRSYNESAYTYFHTGLDFCGGEGDPIYSPEAGVVVFAGSLTVRGNATLIDHGWGVYSGFMHQSEILVDEGDIVKRGQLIGRVGATGRVTGPHLHWEMFVGGVQVDPSDWLQSTYP